MRDLMQEIKRIYLHWTATGYGWAEPGHYHAVVDDKGGVKRLTDYHERLNSHTYGRNKDSVAIAAACMLNSDWKNYGPTKAQVDGMCKEAAKIALGLKWEPNKLFLSHRIMTHAEAAANRDYSLELVKKFSGKSPSADYDHAAQEAGLPHYNYGPSSWPDKWPGGDVVRWDLWKITEGDAGGTGGDKLREKIVEWMIKIKAEGGEPKVVASEDIPNSPFGLDKFRDFFRYYDDDSPQKKEAIKRLFEAMDPKLLNDGAYWVKAWRTRPPAPARPPTPPTGTGKVSVQASIKIQAQHKSKSCGQTCVAMVVTAFGGKVVDDYWVDGNYGFGLLNCLNNNTGDLNWGDAGDFKPAMWNDIYASLKNGHPVIIGLNGPEFSPSGYGHILLIVAMDGDKVTLADPNGGYWRVETKKTIESCPPHTEGKFVFMVK